MDYNICCAIRNSPSRKMCALYMRKHENENKRKYKTKFSVGLFLLVFVFRFLDSFQCIGACIFPLFRFSLDFPYFIRLTDIDLA